MRLASQLQLRLARAAAQIPAQRDQRRQLPAHAGRDAWQIEFFQSLVPAGM